MIKKTTFMIKNLEILCTKINNWNSKTKDTEGNRSTMITNTCIFRISMQPIAMIIHKIVFQQQAINIYIFKKKSQGSKRIIDKEIM